MRHMHILLSVDSFFPPVLRNSSTFEALNFSVK
jgi:hypothetical protein